MLELAIHFIGYEKKTYLFIKCRISYKIYWLWKTRFFFIYQTIELAVHYAGFEKTLLIHQTLEDKF